MVDESIQIEGALYGHKGDLKEKFTSAVTVEDDEVSVDGSKIPRWANTMSVSGKRSERIEWAVTDARRSDWNTGLASFRLVQSRSNGNTPPPVSIRESLSEYMDTQYERDRDSCIPPREGFRHKFHLMIRFNSQGTVTDMWVDSHFKN